MRKARPAWPNNKKFVHYKTFYPQLKLFYTRTACGACDTIIAEIQPAARFQKTDIMQMLTNLLLLAHQLKPTAGLRVIDNGLGLPVYGAEERMVDYALLAADRKADLPRQVQAFCF